MAQAILVVSGPVIRAATENDVAAIAEIYGHHVKFGTATFELDPPDLVEMRRRHAELTGRGFPYLVVEQDGMIAGYAYASPYRPRPAYRFTVEDSIYLHPAKAGKGLGSLLLRKLIADCESGPAEQMIAVIGDSANTASIRLHEKLGFQHVGILRAVGFKFDRWIDTVLMQRALKSGGPLPEA